MVASREETKGGWIGAVESLQQYLIAQARIQKLSMYMKILSSLYVNAD
jgi:hypothetical protein